MVTCDINQIGYNLKWLRVALREGYVMVTCGYVFISCTLAFSV